MCVCVCVCAHFVLCVYFIMISAVIINAAEMLLFFVALCVRVCFYFIVNSTVDINAAEMLLFAASAYL